VLSAVGLAITSERRERLVSVLQRASDLDESSLVAAGERAAEGVMAGNDWSREWTARMRYVGQGYELDVAIRSGDDGHALAARFDELHQRRNGFTLDAPAEIIGIRHVASGPAHAAQFSRTPASQWNQATAIDDGGMFDAELQGPAVVVLEGATLRIAEGWVGVPHATGGWILTRTDSPA
jgi:N-methylhydantoinase A/oxoprolinase/acetone carboxylase beta subunit